MEVVVVATYALKGEGEVVLLSSLPPPLLIEFSPALSLITLRLLVSDLALALAREVRLKLPWYCCYLRPDEVS